MTVFALGKDIVFPNPELAEEVLKKFASRVENFAVVEQKAKLEGRNMTMLLAPNTSK